MGKLKNKPLSWTGEAFFEMKIPENIGYRLGDISKLPKSLLQQLNRTKQQKRDKIEEDIILSLKNDLGGVATLDEIMVSLYRKNKEIIKRRNFLLIVFRMARSGKIQRVKGFRGVYRV